MGHLTVLIFRKSDNDINSMPSASVILVAGIASIFLLLFFVFCPIKAESADYHTIAVIDDTNRMNPSDASLTHAINSVTSYRLETVEGVSVVPSFDLDMYIQESDIDSLWSMDKPTAKKFSRASNADLIIIGRHILSSSGSANIEFHIIYLALDETIRTSKISIKHSTSNVESMQKDVFDKLSDKLPISHKNINWKKQNIIKKKNVFNLFGEGLRNIADQRDEAGLSSFEKALKIDPGDRDIHYYIGRYYAAKQYNYERATYHLNEILKNNHADSRAHYWLGFTYYLKADYASALKEFETVKSQSPYIVENLLLLGTLYEEKGNYSAAAGSYRDALKLVPQRASIWYSLAAALSITGKSDEAISALKRTLELDKKGFYDMVRTDADLAPLRKSQAYQKLIESYK